MKHSISLIKINFYLTIFQNNLSTMSFIFKSNMAKRKFKKPMNGSLAALSS